MSFLLYLNLLLSPSNCPSKEIDTCNSKLKIGLSTIFFTITTSIHLYVRVIIKKK